jgi:hypothetical protein
LASSMADEPPPGDDAARAAAGSRRAGVLGVLPEDAAAAVLAHVPPPALLRCAVLSCSLRILCRDVLQNLSALDLSLQSAFQQAGAVQHGLFALGSLETYEDFAAVRESVVLLREPLRHDHLGALLRRMPNLSRLSLQGRRLLVASGGLFEMQQAGSNHVADFGEALFGAAIQHLNLSFAQVLAPAGWGPFVPPSLLSLDARGFETQQLHLLLSGLAEAPRLRAVSFEGAGTFRAGIGVNPYDTIRSIVGQPMPESEDRGAGCRGLQSLSLGSCHGLRLLGSKALLHVLASNSALTALDLRNVLVGSQGDALFRGLALGALHFPAVSLSPPLPSPPLPSLSRFRGA